jgi:predicted nucleotidyltransferase
MLKQKEIVDYLQQYNAEKLPSGIQLVGLFGSYARGTQDSYSDVDITYRIDHDIFYKDNAFKKLIALEEIKKELECALHHRVDLIPADTNNVLLKRSLQKEQIFL